MARIKKTPSAWWRVKRSGPAATKGSASHPQDMPSTMRRARLASPSFASPRSLRPDDGPEEPVAGHHDDDAPTEPERPDSQGKEEKGHGQQRRRALFLPASATQARPEGEDRREGCAHDRPPREQPPI